jgi:curved DNA-binding protein CbpA
MSELDQNKDHYATLGADRASSPKEIERLYKRLAARHHPDRGGSEAKMKSLNEAYGVLRDESTRRAYDAQRGVTKEASFVPVSTPPARDVGMHGQGLSALLCLLVGLFLLLLVHFQWIWFLWPLAILAFFVILFGVLLAHAAMLSLNASLPNSNPFRRHLLLWEAVFWTAVGGAGYGIYLLLTSV